MDEKKSKNECVGHIPYGFKLCQDGVHLEQCEEEQNVIVAMLQLRDQGISTRKGAKILNDMNLFNRGNKPWSRSAFLRILTRHGADVNRKSINQRV